MNNRIKKAKRLGAIKVYLLPDEIAFITNCLTWVKSELEVTSAKLSKLNELSGEYKLGDELKRFHDLVLPVFEITASRLLSECSEHFKEIEDDQGYEKVLEMQKEWANKFDTMKKLKDTIIGAIESGVIKTFLAKLENI